MYIAFLQLLYTESVLLFNFLKINDRVGVDFRDQALYSWTFLLDDTLEDFAGVLLALVMTNDADLNLLLMTEVFMICLLYTSPSPRDRG